MHIVTFHNRMPLRRIRHYLIYHDIDMSVSAAYRVTQKTRLGLFKRLITEYIAGPRRSTNLNTRSSSQPQMFIERIRREKSSTLQFTI